MSKPCGQQICFIEQISFAYNIPGMLQWLSLHSKLICCMDSTVWQPWQIRVRSSFLIWSNILPAFVGIVNEKPLIKVGLLFRFWCGVLSIPYWLLKLCASTISLSARPETRSFLIWSNILSAFVGIVNGKLRRSRLGCFFDSGGSLYLNHLSLFRFAEGNWRIPVYELMSTCDQVIHIVVWMHILSSLLMFLSPSLQPTLLVFPKNVTAVLSVCKHVQTCKYHSDGWSRIGRLPSSGACRWNPG